jgi:hypothetical protein
LADKIQLRKVRAAADSERELRFVELLMQQADAREDLQAAVREAQARGDAPGIEALRSKLYEPIVREMECLQRAHRGKRGIQRFKYTSVF